MNSRLLVSALFLLIASLSCEREASPNSQDYNLAIDPNAFGQRRIEAALRTTESEREELRIFLEKRLRERESEWGSTTIMDDVNVLAIVGNRKTADVLKRLDEEYPDTDDKLHTRMQSVIKRLRGESEPPSVIEIPQ
jgi:hypothetical protein